MLAKQLEDSHDFTGIAYRRRGAMYVDIIDSVAGESGIRKCIAHGKPRTEPFWMGGRDVVRIRAHSCSGKLGINLRPPCLRVFEAFQHYGSTAFARYESVPIFIERPRGSLGIIVSCGQGMHG